MSDDEIIDFYHKVNEALKDKDFEIVYILVDDIQKTEEIIKKERSDEEGNEMWFPLMINYLEEAPFSKVKGYKGMEGLVLHLEHRIKLEKRILSEVFNGHYKIIERKI